MTEGHNNKWTCVKTVTVDKRYGTQQGPKYPANVLGGQAEKCERKVSGTCEALAVGNMMYVITQLEVQVP